MGQGHVLDRPLHIALERRPKAGFLGKLSVICCSHETCQEPTAEVAHIPVPRVHGEQARLIDTEGRIRGWAAKNLGPIGGESFDVFGVLTRMGKSMAELRIRQTTGVVRPS